MDQRLHGPQHHPGRQPEVGGQDVVPVLLEQAMDALMDALVGRALFGWRVEERELMLQHAVQLGFELVRHQQRVHDGGQLPAQAAGPRGGQRLLDGLLHLRRHGPGAAAGADRHAAHALLPGAGRGAGAGPGPGAVERGFWRDQGLHRTVVRCPGMGQCLAGLSGLRRGGRAPRTAANPGRGHGAYVAFLDISLGITGPVLGAAAGAWGVEAVYLAGAVAVALPLLVALRPLRAPAQGGQHA